MKNASKSLHKPVPKPVTKRLPAPPAPDLAAVSTRVEVRHSPIHGHGVFAARSIPSGTLIGRYVGRRYTPEQAEARAWENTVTYVFGLSDGSLIDGAEGGNATRFINHSCAPNCSAYELEGDDGELWIEIEASKRVAAGQELFLDYSLDAGDHAAGDFGCACGTPACRGTMTA